MKQVFLGNVKEVIAWFDGPEFSERGYFLKPDNYPPLEEPIPAGLDWDLWLGPAASGHTAIFIFPVSGEVGMSLVTVNWETGPVILWMLHSGRLTLVCLFLLTQCQGPHHRMDLFPISQFLNFEFAATWK